MVHPIIYIHQKIKKNIKIIYNDGMATNYMEILSYNIVKL